MSQCACELSCFSRVPLFAIPWTVAHQAPLSVGISRQEYWSGLPFPSPGDLPDPGIEPSSPALQADSLPSEPPGKPHRTLGGLKSVGNHSKGPLKLFQLDVHPCFPPCTHPVFLSMQDSLTAKATCFVFEWL